jgi:protein SCO1/2
VISKLSFGNFSRKYILLSIVFLLFVNTVWGQAIQTAPLQLKGIDIKEHLGDKIPLNLIFTNENGEQVALGKYFKTGKPVILVLAYYECPMLCTLVLNGLADGIRSLDYFPGKDYQVLTVSIDPTETSELAKAKKKNLIPLTGKAETENAWHFFVGSQDQIDSLTKAVGFIYYYDTKQKQYAHPAALMLLTPDGTISRYLYGVGYKKQDLRLGLLEASQGKIGNTVDRIILYCYHYDPNSQGYVLFANNLMKLGGLVTVAIIAIFMASLWARERRKKIIGAAKVL